MTYRAVQQEGPLWKRLFFLDTHTARTDFEAIIASLRTQGVCLRITHVHSITDRTEQDEEQPLVLREPHQSFLRKTPQWVKRQIAAPPPWEGGQVISLYRTMEVGPTPQVCWQHWQWSDSWARIPRSQLMPSMCRWSSQSKCSHCLPEF